MHDTPTTILIAGPTASGKSSLAMALADRLGGTIINADSMQVYRELRIITARPTVEDEAAHPHKLFGFVSASEAYSAGRYARDAAAAIAAVRAAGQTPIVVGGTGLYFKVLIEGLAPVPEIPAYIRAHWRGEAESLGAQKLHDALRERDPEMADRLHATDTQRIVRALEVINATGKSLAEWQKETSNPVLDPDQTHRLVLFPAREQLHARVTKRLATMMDEGAIEEAGKLDAMQLDATLPAMRAIGVRPLIQAARGDYTTDEAIDAAATETRQYIKRQATWLKRNMMSWNWITEKQMKNNRGEYLTFIQR